MNAKDSRRFSALHYAAASGFYAVAHFLLSRGADPNVRDEAGNTPLYWAAFCGHTELVLLLLQAGAVPYLANWVGESPLLVAVQAGNEQMVSLLLSAGAVNATCLEGGITPLHLAAALGTERIALMLLRAGAFVNMLDEYGTSLSFGWRASHITHHPRYLLTANAGETPLVYAVKEGHTSTAQLLVSVGADARALDEEEPEPYAYYATTADRKFVAVPAFADVHRPRTAVACAMVASPVENPLRPIRTLC